MKFRWKTQYYCLICGNETKTKSPTCGSPHCQAVFILHPELEMPGRVCTHPTNKTAPSHQRRRNRDLMEPVLTQYQGAAVEEVDSTIEIEGRKDPRRKKFESSGFFDHLSPKTCLFKLTSKEVDEVGLELERPKGKDVRGYFAKQFGGYTFVRAHDAVLAWRCGCPNRKEVVYETMKDLPIKPGRYGICPRCNSAALRIIEES